VGFQRGHHQNLFEGQHYFMYMSLQNPWVEKVLWQGSPAFRAEVVGTIGICWTYGVLFTVINFVYDWFYHPDRIIYVLKAFLTLLPLFAVIAVVSSYWRHRHQYVITVTHIYIKKWKTWQSYPLENVLSIDVRKYFFVQLFGAFLDIHVGSSDPEKPARSRHVRLHNVESPHTVKEIIDQAVKAVKSAHSNPDQPEISLED